VSVNVQVNGQPHQVQVRGRVALIVRWLIARRDKLNASEKMRVVFDCAGSSVRAEVREREQVDPALLHW
jgi:hypothetical protein